MKIHHLIGAPSIIITNEEKKFIQAHSKEIPLSALDERGVWIAQNLVRKNVYKLTNNDKHIVLNSNETQQPTI